MKQDATFQFDLSRAELHWLAGALGIARLPLPEDAPAGFSPSQLESLQKDGHASLLTRGLLRPSPGFGWQAERLPAALLQWIASARSLLRLEHIPKGEPSRRAHLFTAGEQGLSLEMDGEAARFVLFQNRLLLRESAMRWLALPAKTKKSAITHELPQPLTFLPAAWNDPSLAARILKERGVNPKRVESALDWVASLEWVAVLSKIKLEGTRNTVTGQFALCGDGKSSWGGRDDGAKVSFVRSAAKTISATIGEML